MKITFQGFQLQPGDGISLAEFAELLIENSSAVTEHKFADHNRLFLFEKETDADYFTGLLITAKDQRTFPELRKLHGELLIKVSELEEDARLMDFNFFVLNKKTFCGIYQHYNASCSPLRFGTFLRYSFWNPERKLRIQSYAQELVLNHGKRPEKAEAAAKHKFRRSLKFALFYKPDDFAKILKTMKEVRQFHFDIATRKAQQSVFSPAIPIKGVQERVVFANTKDVVGISDAIAGFVQKEGVKKGKALAIDPDDEVRPVYLNQNIAGFGEFDFDAVMASMSLKVEEFAKSALITELLQAARNNKALFG